MASTYTAFHVIFDGHENLKANNSDDEDVSSIDEENTSIEFDSHFKLRITFGIYSCVCLC